jgi:uncharacterized membrane protein YqaE (UPF0057 family)
LALAHGTWPDSYLTYLNRSTRLRVSRLFITFQSNRRKGRADRYTVSTTHLHLTNHVSSSLKNQPNRSAPLYKHTHPHTHTPTQPQIAKMPFTGSDICKIIFAVILPPLGVFLERGCGADLLINILLTILGYIPGIIHALYVLLRSNSSFQPANHKLSGTSS